MQVSGLVENLYCLLVFVSSAAAVLHFTTNTVISLCRCLLVMLYEESYDLKFADVVFAST